MILWCKKTKTKEKTRNIWDVHVHIIIISKLFEAKNIS